MRLQRGCGLAAGGTCHTETAPALRLNLAPATLATILRSFLQCRKNERPAAELANEKWGWISEVPGSWAELQVDASSDLQARGGRQGQAGRQGVRAATPRQPPRQRLPGGRLPRGCLLTPACLRPPACALQGDLRPETNDVVVTYLKSYQHMGKARVECVSGCK